MSPPLEEPQERNIVGGSAEEEKKNIHCFAHSLRIKAKRENKSMGAIQPVHA